MKKILVPTIDWPVSSDAAYRVAEIADAIGANVIVLFVAQMVGSDSYRRGNLSIEIFEEAAQGYGFKVDGYIVTGNPTELIKRMAKKFAVDLILLGATEENDWSRWKSEDDSLGNCQVHVLATYSPDFQQEK